MTDVIDDAFAAGDVVPNRFRDDDGDPVRFAVAVEVYAGYGGKRHVYPEERIDGTSALFDGDVTISDDVKLYAVPYDELR
jgi:hypothetical protein